MIINKALAMQTAALARQFWAEVAARCAGQIAPYRAGPSVLVRMPGDPRPRDDETSSGWPHGRPIWGTTYSDRLRPTQ